MFLKTFMILLLTLSLEAKTRIPTKPLNWEEMTLAEKIQWRGTHPDPRINYALLADKLRVKEYVKPYIQSSKVYHATDDPETISLENLPPSFVMKANNASNRNIVVKDSTIIGIKKEKPCRIPLTESFLKEKARKWLDKPYNRGRENQYRLIKPMIYFEEYLDDIYEFALYCINGKVECIMEIGPSYYIEAERYYNLFDVEGNSIDIFFDLDLEFSPPPKLQEMIKIAKTLSHGIDFVRIDFYLANDTIYFGEYTFTPDAGRKILHYKNHYYLSDLWKFPTLLPH